MQTLATELKVQDRTLKLLKRERSVALYKLYRKSLFYGYEVHVIWICEAHEAFGRHFPEMERSPRTSDWGTYGWSYLANDRAGAEKRFSSLLPKYGKNVPPSPVLAAFDPE
jgi:hypothetical protein